MFPCVCLERNKDDEMHITAAIQERNSMSLSSFSCGLEYLLLAKTRANAFCLCYMRVFRYKGIPSSLLGLTKEHNSLKM